MTNKQWTKIRVSVARLIRDNKISLEDANKLHSNVHFSSLKSALNLANQFYEIERIIQKEYKSEYVLDYSSNIQTVCKEIKNDNTNILTETAKHLQSFIDKNS